MNWNKEKPKSKRKSFVKRDGHLCEYFWNNTESSPLLMCWCGMSVIECSMFIQNSWCIHFETLPFNKDKTIFFLNTWIKHFTNIFRWNKQVYGVFIIWIPKTQRKRNELHFPLHPLFFSQLHTKSQKMQLEFVTILWIIVLMENYQRKTGQKDMS